MGRRANRMKSRLKMKDDQLAKSAKKLASVSDEMRRRIHCLEKSLKERDCTDAFRVAVKRMEPFRHPGKVYSVNIMFDVRSIQYGFSYSSSDPVNVSRYVRIMAEDLCLKVEHEIIKTLIEDNMIPSYCR